jgi:hypothetical protein
MFELTAHWNDERLGQHHDAVLSTFALARDEDLSIEVHVLYAKAQTLHQSKTRAVKQCDRGRERGLYLLEQARNFRPRQHDRNSDRAVRATDLLHPGQLDVQYLPV